MRLTRVLSLMAFLVMAMAVTLYGSPRKVSAAPDPQCYPRYVCGEIACNSFVVDPGGVPVGATPKKAC